MIEREGRSKIEVDDIVVMASDLMTVDRGRTERGGRFGIFDLGVGGSGVVEELLVAAFVRLYEDATF